MRLQKYIAECGAASRRKAEELIVAGRVTVNGIRVTEMGVKTEDGDIVCLDGKELRPERKKVYLILNKPSGYITSASDPHNPETVFSLVYPEISERLFAVGRLDKDTEGLLILTNDGDFAYRVTHPKNEVKKTYLAIVNGVPGKETLDKLRRGVMIDGKPTAPATVSIASVEGTRSEVEIIIHEGRNRQVRRMMAAVGYRVLHLRRTAVGNVILGNLPLGRFRHMTSGEVKYLQG